MKTSQEVQRGETELETKGEEAPQVGKWKTGEQTKEGGKRRRRLREGEEQQSAG